MLPLLLLALASSCSGEEPVVTGVPEKPILDAPRLGPPLAEDDAAPPPYEKAANVYVDVRYLAGRSFEDDRAEFGAQLGNLVATRELEQGRELEFTKATLRVVDDRVCMIRVPLPRPSRRGEALEALGFPTQVDRYVTLHREYRLSHEWGFRRIRLRRASPDNELVTEVEAWKWVPGEHAARR